MCGGVGGGYLLLHTFPQPTTFHSPLPTSPNAEPVISHAWPALSHAWPPLSHACLLQVAQMYVTRPLLLQGRKSHLRLWVLVTQHHPLKAYLHRQGFEGAGALLSQGGGALPPSQVGGGCS